MLAIVATAWAGLPWECPDVAVPADGLVYTSTDLAETYAALEDEARTWWDDTCAWAYTTEADGTEVQSCVTGAGASVTYTSWSTSEYDGWYIYDDGWTLEVAPPTGESGWSSLTLTFDDWSFSSGSSTSGGVDTYSASWTGTVLDLPEDGSFTVVDDARYDYSSYDGELEVVTPDCSWTYGYHNAWDEGRYYVVTPEHTLRVDWLYASSCTSSGRGPVYATLDGGVVGAVDLVTWDLAEDDGDTWSIDDGDCDDADPTRHPCADDVAGDGIDQDCDGADDTDADGDGFDALAVGGTDCDDLSVRVYPGGDDDAGDGVDGDCDGADDVDADQDGYTADGDDQPADCEDGAADAHPGGTEVAYDGVDQDCDGGDLSDYDRDGFDAVEAGGDDCDDHAYSRYPGATERPCDGYDQDCDGADECPEADTGASGGGASRPSEPPAIAPEGGDEGEERGGCGSGGAALLLFPLLGRRRRC